MKLRIYGEEPEEQITTLRLVNSGDGIEVVAVDGNGNKLLSGSLIRITSRKRIRRCEIVNPDLGFDLDGDGRIKIDE